MEEARVTCQVCLSLLKAGDLFCSSCGAAVPDRSAMAPRVPAVEARGRIAGERKYLTVLCVDLQRSTDLISNLDPRHTFLELVGEADLPSEFVPAVKRWRYDVMSMFCVYLALDAPVRWKAAASDPEIERCFAVSICEGLDVLDDNASDCRLGVPPRQPGLFTVHPSIFEPSLCPPGREACFCEQIAPYVRQRAQTGRLRSHTTGVGSSSCSGRTIGSSASPPEHREVPSRHRASIVSS